MQRSASASRHNRGTLFRGFVDEQSTLLGFGNSVVQEQPATCSTSLAWNVSTRCLPARKGRAASEYLKVVLIVPKRTPE